MLKPYYEDNERWDEFLKEIRSWNGTPFKYKKMVKGRGADCTLFIGAVWKATKILKEVVIVDYSRDWHIHTFNEIILDSFFYHLNNQMVKGITIERIDDIKFDTYNEDIELMRGDVLGFSTTKTGVTNHAAVYLQKDWMINCVNNRGVCEIQFNYFWRRHLKNHFRIMVEE